MKRPVSKLFTPSATPKDRQEQWHLVDLKGKILGRAASKMASILRGKHRPNFTPHEDLGDHIVAINAEQVVLTGKKMSDKLYYRYTGYPSGLRKRTAGEMIKKHPDEVIIHAVKGMLPKGPLGRKLIKKLNVYAGPNHPHAAQKPQNLEL